MSSLPSRSLKGYDPYDEGSAQGKFMGGAGFAGFEISGPQSLAEMDVQGEIVANYNNASSFLKYLMQNPDSVPANQLAQVMNTITGILDKIVKMREDIYNQQKVVKIEAAIIAALKNAPPEIQDAFLKDYEAKLK